MTRLTVDKLWVDNLSEFIFDDKRVVTFKFLSATLGVHVNIAKQMLYQFHSTNKAAGKKIYATYYVSGAIIQGRSIDPSVSETQNCHDPSSGKHGYVVTLCREKDLDTVKQRIMKVHSVHIYALSAFPLDDLDILKKSMDEPIFKTVNPVDFGPLHCKAALKVRESHTEPKLPQQENKNIAENTANKPDKKKEVNVISPSGKTDLKSTHDDQSSTKSSDRKPVSTASNKKTSEQSDSRLKSMFATAASKPKKAPVVEKKSADTFEKKLDEKKEANVKESAIIRNYNKQKEKIAASKAKQSDSRKRKRIKDVLSSSSEDERPSDDECSPTEPDSPNHRKRNLIESDSDEDIQEVVKKPRSEEPVGPTGRRKVSKTVSKTFMDKDGFLVTTKEQVMISEPETSDTETVSTQNDTDDSKLSKNESNKINEKVSDNKTSDSKTNSKAKTTKTSSVATTTATKSKQSSLFSFFQKK